MSSSSADQDLLNALAEEFAERQRQGEQPALTEYTQRYPNLADQIREIFPALVLMEQLRPAPGEATAAGGAVAPEASKLERLGDYRILREIGRGGMGIVYEAEQESLGRHVALKVLPSHALLDPRQLQRFQREAKAAARLHHTNIVPVYGVGEANGLHYYVMQFIPGQGLDEVLTELRRLRQVHANAPAKTQPDLPPHERTCNPEASAVAEALLSGQLARSSGMPPVDDAAGGSQASTVRPAEAGPTISSSVHLPGQPESGTVSESARPYWQSVARVGIQVAEALAYAHTQGTLHRDIKPSNLLVDTQGTVWITDFGLAKAMEDHDNLTHTGDLVGTLRYMAPERFEGQADARSDLHALGLTLYELLTLRPAFDEADRHKLASQVMHTEPPRPGKLNPRVPRDLETIVLKAMARDPAHRYQTAAELADDLKRFVDDRPIRARRIGPLERFRRWCRRNPAVASLLAVVVVLFVAGFAGVSWNYWQAETARQDLEGSLYFNRISLAQEFMAGNLARGVELLDQCPLSRRGWEWHYLRRFIRHEQPRTLPGHEHEVWRVAFSPDGQLLATASLDQTVRVWDVTTSEVKHVLRGHDGMILSVAFHPDGRRLASGGLDGTVRLWDALAGTPLDTLRDHVGTVFSVSFSPDRRWLASAGQDRVVRLWDLTGGGLSRYLVGHTRDVLTVAFSPDSRLLASGGFDLSLRIWDVATGAPVRTMEETHPDPVGTVAFSPDGRRLATAGWDDIVKVWDAAPGRLLITLRPGAWLNGMAYSPDGRRLALACGDKTVKLWDAASGQEVLSLRGHHDMVQGVAFSPDGKRLASGSADRTVKIWDATPLEETPGEELLTLAGHGSYVWNVAFSPDGGRLVTASHDKTVKIWDAATGREVRTFRRHTRIVFDAVFSPDGRTIASTSWDREADPNQLGDIKLWDAATGTIQLSLRTDREMFCLRFSPDGKLLASGGCAANGMTGIARVWDVATGDRRATLPGHGYDVRDLAFSPDGGQLVTVDRNGLGKLWDTATGREVGQLRGNGAAVWGVAWSRDGQHLATASADRTVKLWDVATRKVVHTLEGHRSDVSGVAFHPDSRLLASASWDATVKLWDVVTGQLLHTFRGHTANVNRVYFSPDGRRLASASDDKTVKVWPVPPTDQLLGRQPAGPGK